MGAGEQGLAAREAHYLTPLAIDRIMTEHRYRARHIRIWLRAWLKPAANDNAGWRR